MTTFAQSVKPVLFVLTSHQYIGEKHEGSGFYLPELTHPLHVLEKAGIPTAFASIQGGLPPVYGVELNDKINAHYWNDAIFQERLKTTLKLSEAKSKDYSAILYVGGHGVMWDFPDSLAIQKITREMYENGQVVAAVCHGPAALVNVRLTNGSFLVDGKRLAAFTNSEEQEVGMADVVPFLLESTLIARGAHHEAAANWQPLIITDGHLITGQNPQSAAGIGEAVRDFLLEK